MTVRVKVVDLGRRYLALRWTDPETGSAKQKSAKTDKRREAEKLAAQLEADLNEGRYVAPSRVTWEQFREQFEAEHLPSLAEGTGRCYDATLNHVERLLRPNRLSEMTTAAVSKLQAKLRDGWTDADGRERTIRETTIAKHMRQLKAALTWAHAMGLLVKMPEVRMPRRARRGKVMKGRPITFEEFERMLEKVPEVVGDEAAPSWRRYLEGMWWSGLRLAESLQLYWDRRDRLCVDFNGQWPMLWIPAELEKGHKDRLLPIAPEFAQFLKSTPESARSGRVFRIQGVRGETISKRSEWISKLGSRIGRAAGIKVDVNATTKHVKYASVHDLRRSFGVRWAARLMPQQLRELMRHESIETTMRFYVGQDAERTAQAMWEAIRSPDANPENEWEPGVRSAKNGAVY